MAYLSFSELFTHIYQEVVDEISRDDNSKLTNAIYAAIEEARGYLTGYDTTAIFAATGSARNAILLLYIKDIAVWHFINLGNVQIDYQQRLDRYEKAIIWLSKVQNGKVNPTLPIALAPVNAGGNLTNPIVWGGGIRRPNNTY